MCVNRASAADLEGDSLMGCSQFAWSIRHWPLLLTVWALTGGLKCVSCKSHSWLPGQYPNPIKFPEACGRGDSVGWICDPDNVLSKEDADNVRPSTP